jgi:hypothetical protein
MIKPILVLKNLFYAKKNDGNYIQEEIGKYRLSDFLVTRPDNNIINNKE